MNAKIKISKETTIANVPACKEIIAALKNAETSLLDCILTETARADEVTTCKAVRGGDCVKTVRKCDLKRIGQTEITVRQAHYDTAPVIEVAFLAEGHLRHTEEFTEIMAKVKVWAKWNDGWYAWEEASDDGSPKAPYAQIYIAE
ncbi:MAG: hypothetical protein PHE09_06915 [Oscillospiraceae bacterium]|nr:hypothetical protein [Oscillospiraceae bacterium]